MQGNQDNESIKQTVENTSSAAAGPPIGDASVTAYREKWAKEGKANFRRTGGQPDAMVKNRDPRLEIDTREGSALTSLALFRSKVVDQDKASSVAATEDSGDGSDNEEKHTTSQGKTG